MAKDGDSKHSSEPELLRAQRYHEQAKALRHMASHEQKPEIREKLLNLAGDYDELCIDIIQRRFGG